LELTPPLLALPVEFAIGILLPIFVLYFRLKMMNSALYQQSAMRKKTPYKLFVKRCVVRLGYPS
jgi:hypothetical protein